MSKIIKKSYASLLSFILMSSSIISCNNSSVTNIYSLEKNQEFRIGNGSGTVKVKLSFNNDSKNFKTKASENGVSEKTKSINLTKVTLVLSTNAVDPYNNPTGTTLDITTGLTSFPKDLTISGLDPNKTYYLSARAFEGANNITKGDTAISSEQFQILANGNINILNDSNTNDIWDITLNLLDGKGASIDSEVYFENGNKGNFDTKEEQVNTDALGNYQWQNNLSINSNGNGVAVYSTEDASSKKHIAARFISDYRFDAPEFYVDDNTLSSPTNLGTPSIMINNKGNGLIAWKEYDGTNYAIKARKLLNYKTFDGNVFNIDGFTSNMKDNVSIGMQNKIQGSQRSALVVWLNNGNLNGKILRTSDSDFSNSFNTSGVVQLNQAANWGDSSLGMQISQIGETNKAMIVWTVDEFTNKKVFTKVVDLDSNTTPDFIGTPSSLTDEPISLEPSGRRKDPSISLNDLGDGIIVWSEELTVPFYHTEIYYKRVTNYGFNNNSLLPAGIKVSSYNGTENQSVPSVSLDSHGNGIIVWEDHRDLTTLGKDIYARKVIGFEPVGKDFRVNTSGGFSLNHQSSPKISLNENLNGVVVWEDTQNSDNDIYSRRILNTNPE